KASDVSRVDRGADGAVDLLGPHLDQPLDLLDDAFVVRQYETALAEVDGGPADVEEQLEVAAAAAHRLGELRLAVRAEHEDVSAGVDRDGAGLARGPVTAARNGGDRHVDC